MFLYKNKNTTEDKNRSTLTETPGMDTEFAAMFNLMQTITCFYENIFQPDFQICWDYLLY